MPRLNSRPSGFDPPGVFSGYQARAYIAERRISNPVSSPPPVLRPVGRYRSDGFTYQAEVTAVMMLRNRIMSTLKARLNTKLFTRPCVLSGLKKSMWLPSMLPGPAVLYCGTPGGVGCGFPVPSRQGRAPNP